VELSACPYVSEEAQQALAAAARPPIRLVTVGGDGHKIEVGNAKKKGFLWQFFHHRPRADQPLAVTKASPKADEPGAANKIKAVTGATISSRSVCDIINEALSGELRQKLAAEAKKAAAATRKATPSTRKATP